MLRDTNSPQTTFSANAADNPYQQVPLSPTSASPNIHNAVLASLHTSTTESVLEWAHFDSFPSLRQNYVSIFHLEQSREPILERKTAIYLCVSLEELDSIIQSFQSTVNFWYPTMSKANIEASRLLITLDEAIDSTSSCLAFLVMALGCASQSISGLFESQNPGQGTSDYRRGRRNMADMYFDGAMKKLHLAHMEVSSTATQCLIFTA